jgi:hypothetical protein
MGSWRYYISKDRGVSAGEIRTVIVGQCCYLISSNLSISTGHTMSHDERSLKCSLETSSPVKLRYYFALHQCQRAALSKEMPNYLIYLPLSTHTRAQIAKGNLHVLNVPKGPITSPVTDPQLRHGEWGHQDEGAQTGL